MRQLSDRLTTDINRSAHCLAPPSFRPTGCSMQHSIESTAQSAPRQAAGQRWHQYAQDGAPGSEAAGMQCNASATGPAATGLCVAYMSPVP